VDCAFSENEVVGDGHGGAIAFFRSDVVIRDCVFTENRAYRGGAIAFFDDSDPLVERCVFTRNANNDLGGAILFAPGIRSVVRNCTFFRNDSGNGGLGGAIMVDGTVGEPGTLRSEANIFVENLARAFGGAIYFKDSNLFTTCDGFYNNRGGTVQGTRAAAGQVFMHDVPLGEDPGFCDLGGEDLRLRSDSPFLADGCEPGAFLPPGCGP
jgi:predicted outer membrane repeat protein